MAGPSYNKRRREKKRQERREAKLQRREERKFEKEGREPTEDGEDPDIAHIVPGPQPPLEEFRD